MRRRSFSLRSLMVFATICAIGCACHYWYKRMNTPVPLPISSQIAFEDDSLQSPAAPAYLPNPFLANEIAGEYRVHLESEVAKGNQGTAWAGVNSSVRRYVHSDPTRLSRHFDEWFADDASDESLVKACRYVRELGDKAGIDRAVKEVTRRLSSTNDPATAAALMPAIDVAPSVLTPHIERALQRFSSDPVVVYAGVVRLEDRGPSGTWDLSEQTIELLKSWLNDPDSKQQYAGIHGLAHTPFRETNAYGDAIRAKIAEGDRLLKLRESAFKDNPASWVMAALADMRDNIGQQTEYTRLICRFGDNTFVDFYKQQFGGWDGSSACEALIRCEGQEATLRFVQENVTKSIDRPLSIMKLLLDQAGAEAIPVCLRFAELSQAHSRFPNALEVARELISRDLGKGNTELIELLAEEAREHGDSSRLRTLELLGYTEADALTKEIMSQSSQNTPEPVQSTDLPYATALKRGHFLADFIDFLNENGFGVPVDIADIEASVEDIEDYRFKYNSAVHEALQATGRAMEFDPVDWMGYCPLLIEQLAELSDGKFAPDGIRVKSGEDRLQLSWRSVVFEDINSAYEDAPGGAIDLVNAILDHFKVQGGRFVSYPNERGNRYPTVAFVTEAQRKTLESQFGLKASVRDNK